MQVIYARLNKLIRKIEGLLGRRAGAALSSHEDAPSFVI